MQEEDPFDTYKVVINHEEQYSIWPAERDNAPGWTDVGKVGTKQECLDYIGEVWTDMRPLSLRKEMEELARNPPPVEPQPDPLPEGKSLVERLCEGKHEVEVSLQPDNTAQELKKCIDRRYIHIRFPNTKGGTELGISLNEDESDWSQGDFESGDGDICLVGELTLDFIDVRCIANIALATLQGYGHLEKI